MGELRPALRGMAEIDPGPEFTRQVLAATAKLPAPGVVGAALPVPVAARTSLVQAAAEAWQGTLERLRETGRRLVARPSFALEAAYVGTLILALVFGTPGSPVGNVPSQAIELASANPVVEVSTLVSKAVATGERAARGRIMGIGERAREASVVDWSRQVATETAVRYRLASDAAGRAAEHGKGLAQAFWSDDGTTVGHELQLLTEDLTDLREALLAGSSSGSEGESDIEGGAETGAETGGDTGDDAGIENGEGTSIELDAGDDPDAEADVDDEVM
jgi:hypothetical protein